MAMLTLEEAALQMTAELRLPVYSITPSLLCEWSRKSEGSLLEILFPFSGHARNAGGQLIDPCTGYFAVPPELLFDLETLADVQIKTFFNRRQKFSVDCPVTVKIGQLFVAGQQINELLSYIQNIGCTQSIIRDPVDLPADLAFGEQVAAMSVKSKRLALVKTVSAKTGAGKSGSRKSSSGRHGSKRAAPIMLVKAVPVPEADRESIHIDSVAPSAFQSVAAHIDPLKFDTATVPDDLSCLWLLNVRPDEDVLSRIVFSALKEKFDSGAPCPTAREVMSLCKKKNKYGVLFIKNELKYLNQTGQLETASVSDVADKIATLTTIPDFAVNAMRSDRMPEMLQR